MFKLILILFSFSVVNCYFTLDGECPKNISLQGEFRLADFFEKWYQVYHFSSDGDNNNNCSTISLTTKPYGIYLNQSRVDLGLFHRYSEGKLEIPTNIEKGAKLDVTFSFPDAPRRLVHRRYPFHVLATNYKYYATVYTCQYSSTINKHYIYVWILSRKQTLNDVSKELALKPLQQLGITSEQLMKDDFSKCTPKYYEDRNAEPLTFRYPVPIL